MQVGIFWTDDGEKKNKKMRSEQSDSDDVTYLIASQLPPAVMAKSNRPIYSEYIFSFSREILHFDS
jgi:hypothetical protein